MLALRARVLRPGQRIRVLVVDDSVVIRRLVCLALEEDPLIEVVGVAANGAIALARTEQLNPDVITLDVEMPELDGLQMLRQLRRRDKETRVVMFSTMTRRGAVATLDALALGADDYVTKASNAGSLDVSLANLRHELLPKIHQFFRAETAAKPVPVASRPGPVAASKPKRYQAVAIGTSTGGPAALAAVIPKFPVGFPLPIFVVQHMPPLFTGLLAERLATMTRLSVKEAKGGECPKGGHIYVAPGDYHMRVACLTGFPEIVLDQSPPLNSCRPAVDALFESLAQHYGEGVIAAVLTGMGHDGLRGSECLRARGARVLAQDEGSSVVWGMPGALVEAGVADEVLPLELVVPAILREVQSA